MGSGISSPCQTNKSVEVRSSLRSLRDPDTRRRSGQKATTLLGNKNGYHNRAQPKKENASTNTITRRSTRKIDPSPNIATDSDSTHKNNQKGNDSNNNNDNECNTAGSVAKSWVNNRDGGVIVGSNGEINNSVLSDSCDSGIMEENRKRSQQHLSRSQRDQFTNSNNNNSNNSDNSNAHQNIPREEGMSKTGLFSNGCTMDPANSFDSCHSRFTLRSESDISVSTDNGYGRSTDSFTNNSSTNSLNGNTTNALLDGNDSNSNSNSKQDTVISTHHGFDTRYNRPVSKHGSLRPNRRSAPNMLQLSIDEAEEDDEMARLARPPRPKSAYVRKRRAGEYYNRSDKSEIEGDGVDNRESDDDDSDDFWSAESVTSDDEDFYSDILSIPDETVTGLTPRGEASNMTNVKLGPTFSKVGKTTNRVSTNSNEDWWTALTPLESEQGLSGIPNSSRDTPSTFRSWLDNEAGGNNHNNLGKKASERSLSSVILLSPCGDPFEADDDNTTPCTPIPVSARTTPRTPRNTMNTITTPTPTSTNPTTTTTNSSSTSPTDNNNRKDDLVQINKSRKNTKVATGNKHKSTENLITSAQPKEVNYNTSIKNPINSSPTKAIEEKDENEHFITTKSDDQNKNTGCKNSDERINQSHNTKTTSRKKPKLFRNKESSPTHANNLSTSNTKNTSIINSNVKENGNEQNATTMPSTGRNNKNKDESNSQTAMQSPNNEPHSSSLSSSTALSSISSSSSSTTSPSSSSPSSAAITTTEHVSIIGTNISECCDCFLHANNSTTRDPNTSDQNPQPQTKPTECKCHKTISDLEEHMFTLVLALSQIPHVSLANFQTMVVTSRAHFLKALATIKDKRRTELKEGSGSLDDTSIPPCLESSLAHSLYNIRESANPSKVSALVLRHLSALKSLEEGNVSEERDHTEGRTNEMPTSGDTGQTEQQSSGSDTQVVKVRECSSAKVITGLPPSSSSSSSPQSIASPGRGHNMINGSKERARTAIGQRSGNNDQGSIISDSQIGTTIVETSSKSPSKKRPDSGIVVSSSASYSSSSEAAREAEVDVTSQTEWIAKSLEMLQDIYLVQTKDHDSLKSLVKAITENCDSDQLKAHAIYRWLSCQSLAYYTRLSPGSKPTVPTSRLKQLADGKINHATLFHEMARSAGLRCEKIDGYAKGDNYLPGSPIRSPGNQHSWNAVSFNGHYSLIDVKFGALPYKFFVEHFFNTPPDEFRLSHYPKDKKWLLMTQAFSLEDFDQTLKTWPTMVAFNIRPLNMKSILRTYDGRLSITVLLRSVAVTPQLEYAGPGAGIDSDSLALLIDQEIRSVDNAETFHVSLPQEGTYFFTLLVHDIEEDEDIPVFQYRIEYADELL